MRSKATFFKLYEENPEQNENGNRKPGEQVREPWAPRGILDDDAHIVFPEDLHQVIELSGRDAFEVRFIRVFSTDLIPCDRDFIDLIVFHLVHKVAEIHISAGCSGCL